MTNQSTTQTGPSGPSKASVKRAYRMLNTSEHQVTRLAIARRYRELLATLDDPHAMKLLASADRLIAKYEADPKMQTPISL